MYVATIYNPTTKEQSEHKFPTEKSVYCFIDMMLSEWNTLLMLVDIEKNN